METIVSTTQEILDRLHSWLPDNRSAPTAANTLFARDADIESEGANRRIREAHLMSPAQSEGVIAGWLEGGPSWLHANLIPMRGGRFLVTVAAGAPVGSPRPSINLSHELDKVVEVVESRS